MRQQVPPASTWLRPLESWRAQLSLKTGPRGWANQSRPPSAAPSHPECFSPPSFVLMKLLSVEMTGSFPGGQSGEDQARFPRRVEVFSFTEAFVQVTDR